MARGGKREGSGRKKGTLNKRSQELVAKVSATGLQPIEVMLITMRKHADAKNWDEAAKVAAMAAPYIHPRLASANVTMDDKRTLAERSAADLERELEQARRDLGGIASSKAGLGEPDQLH